MRVFYGVLYYFLRGVCLCLADDENVAEEDSSVELQALPEKGTTRKPTTEKLTTKLLKTPCPLSVELTTTTARNEPDRRRKTKANAVKPTVAPTAEQQTKKKRTFVRKPDCKIFKKKSSARGRTKKRLRKPPTAKTASLLNPNFDDSLGQTNKMNSRRSSDPSIPTEWFQRALKQLSEKKIRAVSKQSKEKTKNGLSKRTMHDYQTTAAVIPPKNDTSETFNQSVRVLKYSHVLMQLSELLKTYAGKTDDQHVVKQAEKITKIADRKRDSAFALMKSDLAQNLRALKRAENEATDQLRMLRVLSSAASKRAADVPNESVKFDVMKTKENALEVTRKLTEFLAMALAKNESVDVADIVDSILSGF